MDPAVPLVVSQVNPDDLAWHEGIIANPNCSTMQLMPPLMALRDAVGIERMIVDTYQAVAGHRPQGDRRARGAGPGARRGPAQGREASTRTRSRSTPCRTSTCSSTTGTRRRSGRSSPRAARSCTCRTCGSRARPSACPVFISHSEAVHVETRDADHPGRGAGAVRRASRAWSSRTTRRPTCIRWRPTAAGSDEVFVGRVRQDPSIDGNRGLAFWVVSRQPAQGRGVERRGDRRGAASSAAGSRKAPASAPAGRGPSGGRPA